MKKDNFKVYKNKDPHYFNKDTWIVQSDNLFPDIPANYGGGRKADRAPISALIDANRMIRTILFTFLDKYPFYADGSAFAIDDKLADDICKAILGTYELSQYEKTHMSLRELYNKK